MKSNTQFRSTFIVVSLLLGIGIVFGSILFNKTKNIDLVYTPSELQQTEVAPSKIFRIKGMIVKGSLENESNLGYKFKLTDFNNEVTVQYQGVLPDSIDDAQEVVALGKLSNQGEFIAEEVLADKS